MTLVINGIPQPVNVGDKYVKATWYSTVASGSVSGTVTHPAGDKPEVAFIMDDWGLDSSALVSTMDGGKPTFKSPKDAGGSIITTTFNLAGEYVFSGAPSPAGDHAVIFVYKCYLKHFNVEEALFESESVDYEASGSIAVHAAIATAHHSNATDHTQGTDTTLGTMTGNIVMAGAQTVDGRDLSVDGSKLDGIESGAEVNNISDINATDLTDGEDTTLHDHDGISENTSARHAQGTDTALGAVGTKNPPIDADLALYRDSVAGNALVTSTWTQVKAFLKTYFDTLYNKYVHPNHSGDVTSVADGAQTIVNKRTMSATAPITLSNTPTVVAGAVPVIAIPAATNAIAGHATAAHIQAIEANTAKNTNVPTALSVGTVGVNTVAITSDGGADDVTLPAATVNTAGMLTTAKWAEIVANTGKITNATHSGEVTGSAALTITNKAVTLAKMNDMATASLLGRNTAATGVPEVLSKATALSLLNVADGADVTNVILTNDSMADALHRHSELSASDGTPNPALSVDATGNVGIGTTSPDSLLHLETIAGTTSLRLTANDTQMGILFEDSASGLIRAHISYDEAARLLKFQSGSNLGGAMTGSQMVIDSTGDVGIGTTSPTARLHLPAGAAGAGLAPLKLTSGTLLTTPEAGTIEFDGTDFYLTI